MGTPFCCRGCTCTLQPPQDAARPSARLLLVQRRRLKRGTGDRCVLPGTAVVDRHKRRLRRPKGSARRRRRRVRCRHTCACRAAAEAAVAQRRMVAHRAARVSEHTPLRLACLARLALPQRSIHLPPRRLAGSRGLPACLRTCRLPWGLAAEPTCAGATCSGMQAPPEIIRILAILHVGLVPMLPAARSSGCFSRSIIGAAGETRASSTGRRAGV